MKTIFLILIFNLAIYAQTGHEGHDHIKNPHIKKELPDIVILDLRLNDIDFTFNDEKDLISQYFEDLKNLDTLFLIGFNSSLLLPFYHVYRLIDLVWKRTLNK